MTAQLDALPLSDFDSWTRVNEAFSHATSLATLRAIYIYTFCVKRIGKNP